MQEEKIKQELVDEELLTAEEQAIEKIAELQIEVSSEFRNIPTREELEKRKQQVELAFDYLNHIKSLVLKQLTPGHFVSYGDRPYLTAEGAERFRAPLGIGIKDLKGWVIRADGTQVSLDDNNAFVGEIKAVRFEGVFYSKVLGVECYVNGGSTVNEALRGRDDLIFWIKKSQRNFFSYGIKLLLGLSNLTWDELKAFGITKENVPRVEFVKTEKITYEQAQELWNDILGIFNGDDVKAKEYVQKITGKTSLQSLTTRQFEYLKDQVEKIKRGGVKK